MKVLTSNNIIQLGLILTAKLYALISVEVDESLHSSIVVVRIYHAAVLASSPGSLIFQCCFSACNIEKLRDPGDEATAV